MQSKTPKAVSWASAQLLGVGAEDRDLMVPSKLALGDLHHPGGDVHRRHVLYAPAQIVRDQDPGARGHVQRFYAGGHPRHVQNAGDHRLVADHARVPGGGQAVKEFDHVLGVDHSFSLEKEPHG